MPALATLELCQNFWTFAGDSVLRISGVIDLVERDPASSLRVFCLGGGNQLIDVPPVSRLGAICATNLDTVCAMPCLFRERAVAGSLFVDSLSVFGRHRCRWCRSLERRNACMAHPWV
eukprot:1310905-Rhodomonas_salina.1